MYDGCFGCAYFLVVRFPNNLACDRQIDGVCGVVVVGRILSVMVARCGVVIAFVV